jgi:hypothetical protein
MRIAAALKLPAARLIVKGNPRGEKGPANVLKNRKSLRKGLG